MLTLASGRRRVDVTVTEPEGYSDGDPDLPLEITVADLASIVFVADAVDQINKPDLNLSASDSDTVPDAPLSSSGNAVTFGASNYEGSITNLRELDADGHVDPLKDTLNAAIGTKGDRAWYFDRFGPKATIPLGAGDEGWIYEAVSDEPKDPSDVSGYIKNVIKLGVQSRRRFKIVAA